MGDEAERVDGVAVDHDRDADELAFLVAVHGVVEARIAAADGFEAVVEVEDDLVERQAVDGHGAVADVCQVGLLAAAFVAEREHGAEIVVGHHDGGADPGLLDGGDGGALGHVGGVVELLDGAVGAGDAVDDRGCGGDQVEVELPAQALLDDFKVEEAQKAAAIAEAECRRGFGFVVEGGVVEAELAEGFAELLEVVGVDGEQAAPDDGDGGLEAGERVGGRASLVGDGVADVAVGDGFDGGVDVAHLARAELVDG